MAVVTHCNSRLPDVVPAVHRYKV